MATERVERRLAAILAADVAGYSRLMAHDEVGTLARLKAGRDVMDGLIAAHRGRIFNTAGGSVVADFASAVDAVQCAVAVQEAVDNENAGRPVGEEMQFRIGIHVGDVMSRGQTCSVTRSTSRPGSRRLPSPVEFVSREWCATRSGPSCLSAFSTSASSK